jgi:RNA polymerase sigma-70 factor (ECF subfamily)
MNTRPKYSEKDVLYQLAQGDESAFRIIYDTYWYSIYKTAKRYTKSVATAEDIVQEIFTTLWSNRTKFTEVLHLEYYLITMTKNLTLRTIRKIAHEEVAKNSMTEEFQEIESEVEDRLLDQQYDQLVQQAVRLLPSQQKQVFQLAKEEGLSHKDIAAQLNISHLTVKAHMAKALRFIRHYLQPHVDTNILCVILFRILFF